MGIIQKFTLASSDLKTYNTGLQWSFPHIEVFANSDEEEKSMDGKGDEKFIETDYFEKRKNEYVIEFKKEPPKSSTQCFEVKYLVDSVEQWIRFV